jgi:hypothetical protein
MNFSSRRMISSELRVYTNTYIHTRTELYGPADCVQQQKQRACTLVDVTHLLAHWAFSF